MGELLRGLNLGDTIRIEIYDDKMADVTIHRVNTHAFISFSCENTNGTDMYGVNDRNKRYIEIVPGDFVKRVRAVLTEKKYKGKEFEL